MMSEAPRKLQLFANRPDANARKSKLYLDIMAQPHSLSDTIHEQVSEVALFSKYLMEKEVRSMEAVACGSSKNAAHIGGHFLRPFVRLDVHGPSEYSGISEVLLLLSQSGESKDLLDVLEHAMKEPESVSRYTPPARKPLIVGLTNTIESTISRQSHFQIYTNAKKEESIAATGTMTSAVATLFHIYSEMAFDASAGGKCWMELLALPERVSRFIDDTSGSPQFTELAGSLRNAGLITFLGERDMEHVAAEAALKLTETAGSITLSSSTSMFRHGYLAPYGADFGPVAEMEKAIVVFSSGGQDAPLLDFYADKASRGGFGLHTVVYDEPENGAAAVFIPAKNALERTIFSIVFAQMLAHDLAAMRGNEPGEPDANGTLSKIVK